MAEMVNLPLSEEMLRRAQATADRTGASIEDVLLKWLERGSTEEIDQIKKLYSFKDERTVLDFLSKYPFLIPILREMYPKFEPYFPDPNVMLRVVESAEVEDEVQLFAFITTSLMPKEAVKRLEQLGDDWGLAAMEHSQHLLCITLKYS